MRSGRVVAMRRGAANLVRALVLVTWAAPIAAVAYLVLALALNLLPVAQVWLTRQVINELVQHAGSTVLITAALYGLTLLVPAALQPVQDTLMAWLEDRAVAAVDTAIVEAGIRIPDLQRIEGGAFGDDLKLIQESYSRAPRLIWVLPPVVGGLAALAGLLLLLARLQPLLPVALVAATVPRILAAHRISALKYGTMQERSRPAREMDYAVRVLTDPAAAKELRVFGQSGFFLGRFRERFARVLTEGDRERRLEIRFSLLTTGLQALTLAGGFLYVARQAGSGALTLGDIALYIAAVSQVESRLSTLTTALRNLQETMLHLGGLFRFLDSAGPAIQIVPAPAAVAAPAIFATGLQLRDLTFRYGEEGPAVLDGLTATLPAGQVTPWSASTAPARARWSSC